MADSGGEGGPGRPRRPTFWPDPRQSAPQSPLRHPVPSLWSASRPARRVEFPHFESVRCAPVHSSAEPPSLTPPPSVTPSGRSRPRRSSSSCRHGRGDRCLSSMVDACSVWGWPAHVGTATVLLPRLCASCNALVRRRSRRALREAIFAPSASSSPSHMGLPSCGSLRRDIGLHRGARRATQRPAAAGRLVAAGVRAEYVDAVDVIASTDPWRCLT